MSSITSEAVCASKASSAFTYGPLVCFIWVIKFLTLPWTLPWRRSAFSSYPVASARPMCSSEMVQLQATDMPRAKWDREGAFTGSTQEFHSPGGQDSPQEGLEPDGGLSRPSPGALQDLSMLLLSLFFPSLPRAAVGADGQNGAISNALSAPGLHANSTFVNCYFRGGKKGAISLPLPEGGM